jgi:hypothetical protein
VVLVTVVVALVVTRAEYAMVFLRAVPPTVATLVTGTGWPTGLTTLTFPAWLAAASARMTIKANNFFI